MSIVERALSKIQDQAAGRAHRVLPPPPAPARARPAVALKQDPIALPSVERLRELGLAPHESMSAVIAEEFRRAKRPLVGNAFGDSVANPLHGNLLMVAGGEPGAGKSFVAFNLALSIANDIDHDVLLVDGDVIKQKLTNALGLHGKPGLMDILVSADLREEDHIYPTDHPGLSVLGAGTPHPGAAELFMSSRMRDLATRLSELQPNRMVIFDSAPALLTNEAQALAGNMGQFVIVVEHGKTARRAVRSVVELLDETKPISLLLNKSTSMWAGASSQTYGYDYGSYY